MSIILKAVNLYKKHFILAGFTLFVVLSQWPDGGVTKAVSDIVDITAVVPSNVVDNFSGGNSSNNPINSSITISGEASPNARLVFLKDGQVSTTFYVQPNGSFSATFNNLVVGNYNYGIYYEDAQGNFSNITNLSFVLSNSSPIVKSGVVLSPTIIVSPIAVAASETVFVSGFATPNSTVYIYNSGNLNAITSVIANNQGFYSANVRVTNIPGEYYFYAKFKNNNGQESDTSRVFKYMVVGVNEAPDNTDNNDQKPIDGNTEGPGSKPSTKNFPKCVDPNKNGRVNLVDFSILLYWFDKNSPPTDIDCNKDDKINLVDFSILMYFWTG